MTETRLLSFLQWAGWGLIAVLCVVVGLLWARMERQVVQNATDISDMKAYSDAQDIRVEQEGQVERALLERRWGQYLMPTLRYYHEALQSLPLPPEYQQPMPDWLKEQP